MLENEHADHRGEDAISFFMFKMVKGCCTLHSNGVASEGGLDDTTERKVLHKRGQFNRCQLTRIDVDVLLEKKCWNHVWT